MPDMAAGSIELSQGMGGHKVRFLDPVVYAGDELALPASSRQCLKNGNPCLLYTSVFDSANRLVNLLAFSGTDSGALFFY